jgi:hypothetical protein
MSDFWIICIVLLAVLGNLVMRRVVRKVDKEPETLMNPTQETPANSSKELSILLVQYGQLGGAYSISQEHLPLNQKIVDVASSYQEVHFDSLIRVFDRSLMQAPFADNTEFLQIGNWGDGSEVLVKRQSEDPKVYIASIEDGAAQHPSILAASFEEYMFKALRDFEDANVIMRKHADG